MSLSSNQYSNSFSQGSFQLFIQLIYTNSIYKIMNRIFIWLASENYSNIKSNEDIVIGGAGTHWEFICNILLCYQKLDTGPRQAEDNTAFFLDMIKFSMLCNNGVSSFRTIRKYQNIGSTKIKLKTYT